MAVLRVLKPREVIQKLRNLGFVEVRQRGSHIRFKHPDGRSTTVPMHKGRDVSFVVLKQIANDVGLSVKEFVSAR